MLFETAKSILLSAIDFSFHQSPFLFLVGTYMYHHYMYYEKLECEKCSLILFKIRVTHTSSDFCINNY